MMFVFQACYGAPKDFGRDAFIHGKVFDKSTGTPLKGIKVSVGDGYRYDITDDDGSFTMYLPSGQDHIFSFTVPHDETNLLRFQPKDTIITPKRGDNISFSISLDPCY